jgi:hypothetical protein
MIKTIKARYHAGKIEPLEPLELEGGSEILISILTPSRPTVARDDGTTPTFGVFEKDPAWEALQKELNDRRLPEARASGTS